MASRSWFPDELAHAGPEHLDAEYIVGYDRKAEFDPTEDVNLLRTLGLDETHTVMDIGAGTGTFALAAAPHCRKVVAVDVSAGMLAALKTRAETLGIENIESVQAGFLTYEGAEASADFVYSRNALHHLPDFWKALALARIATVLKPGGVLRLRDLVYVCGVNEIEPIIEAWLGRALENRGWSRAELEVHVRDEFSPFNWLLEPMLAQAGLTIQEATYDPSRLYAAYTCVKNG